MRLPRYHLPEYSSGEVSLIEAVAGNGLVAGQLLLTGIAEEKRVRWYAAHRPERHRAPVRCVFSTKAGNHSNAGGELLLFSTVEVTPVLE